MWDYLRDKLVVAGLRARYERRVQESLAAMLEEGERVVSGEGNDWVRLGGGGKQIDGMNAEEVRNRARALVRENPHARNVLRLLEAYVVGDGLRLSFQCCNPAKEGAGKNEALETVGQYWKTFLRVNANHFSYAEFARRIWRDGECFVRFFDDAEWPPRVRFVDPERVGSNGEDRAEQGIVTDLDDVETVLGYQIYDRDESDASELVDAAEMVHVKYGVDSNEKRGISFFAPLLEPLRQHEEWQGTELAARKLQSSIVLWRKVQGGAGQASDLAERSRSGSRDGVRGERVKPGSIVTTSSGTDMKFLQPNTNYGDAVPLGRSMLLSVAAGAGLPEFMLTGDASNGNYASTMVAEGPAVKLFRAEQEKMAGALERIWWRVMQCAVESGLIGSEELSEIELKWSYPELVSRDRPREREADVRLIEAGVLSRSEVRRREKLDPEQIAAERALEREGD